MADDSEELSPSKRADFLATSRKRFQLASDAESEQRKEAIDDDRFRALEHWPEKIKQQRDTDQRPCLTIDKLSQPIRQITNQERQGRPAIQINPVSGGADQATAEIQQGLIRQIEQHSFADVAYDWAFDGAVSHGWGYFRVLTEYESDTSFDQIIKIDWIENQYSVFFDPSARAWNKRDAMWCHLIEDLTPESYNARYARKNGNQTAKSLAEFTGLGTEHPTWFPDNGVRIAEYFYVEETEAELVELTTGETLLADQLPKRLSRGVTVRNRRPVRTPKVRWCLHNALEILEKREWAGKFIPIIEVEGERLNVDGKRIKRGLIRASRDPSRMYDYWVSAATETTALAPRAPWIMYEGQDEGYEGMWATANTVPYSALKARATSKLTGNQILPLPQRSAIEPPIQAMMQGVKQAELDIHSTTAFYDASDPRRANTEQSGRAVLARKEQGAQTNMNFADNLNRSLRYLGELLLDLMPKIYDRPGRVVQIIGADDEVRQIMLGQRFQKNAQTGAPEAVPPEVLALQQGLGEFYDLNKGQYAVTVTVGHSFTTRRQEAVASMLELVNAQPAMAPIVSDVLVENMDWPGAPKLAARLKKMLPPPLQEQKEGQPSPDQLQAQLQQMGMQLQQLQQVAQRQGQGLQTNKAGSDSKERIAAADRESKERIAVLQAQTQQLIAAMKTAGDQQEAKLQAQIDMLSQQMGLEADLIRNQAQTTAQLTQQERQLASDHLTQTRDLAFQAQNAHTAASERAAQPAPPPTPA